MNIRISLLSVVVLTMSVYAGAQTARNPLNHEPSRILLQKRASSMKFAEETFYRADGTFVDKRLFTYNESGQKTSNTNLIWNENDASWQNSSKNDFVYEANKNITISSVKNLTGWQNTTKTETIYNSEHKQIYSLTYSWDKNIDDWSIAPTQKSEWVYDSNGLATEYLKKRFDAKTGDWSIVEARILYSYDEKDALVEELYQLWDADSNLWQNGGKYTYSKNNETQQAAMSYFYVSDKWIFDGKIIYLYDTDGKLTRGDYYDNDTDNTLKAYSLYSYSEKSCHVVPETAEINIYPNPVVSSFELTVPAKLVGKTAGIFDVYGKFVKSVVVNNEKVQVNVNGIYGGVYVLQIGDTTKKFVIK